MSERKDSLVREERDVRRHWSTGYLIRYAGQLRVSG